MRCLTAFLFCLTFLVCTACSGRDTTTPAKALIGQWQIKEGKIEGFEGDNETINNVEKHYQKISKMFNISKNIVDSWHAGIHPGTYYNKPIEENPDRWSNTIFGSPKYLHFHTCGDYPPGEICWMIENPSITIQDIPLWENGNLMLKNFEETRYLLEKWVDLKKLFVN